MKRWKLILHIPRGHRYFEEVSTGKIAVADYSGPTPDQTEDGVLYLARDRVIEIGGSPASSAIPITKPGDGKILWTGENPLGGLLVAEAFKMRVRLKDWLGPFVEKLAAIDYMVESGAVPAKAS